MQKQLNLRAVLILCMWSVFVAWPAHASSIQQIEFSDMARTAEAIVEAEVVAIEVKWNAAGTRIHTYVDFKIIDVINGQLHGDKIRLRFLGGQVGQDQLLVEGLVYPQLGEQGIYFIESLKISLINPLIGWNQGHFKLDEDGSVMTNQNLPVESVDPKALIQNKKLSTGIANGVRVQQRTSAVQGLQKAQFKHAIELAVHD